jgi:hypothetical protein
LYFGKEGLLRNVNQSFHCSFRCTCIWPFEERVRNSESDEIVKKAEEEGKVAFTAPELEIFANRAFTQKSNFTEKCK